MFVRVNRLNNAGCLTTRCLLAIHRESHGPRISNGTGMAYTIIRVATILFCTRGRTLGAECVSCDNFVCAHYAPHRWHYSRWVLQPRVTALTTCHRRRRREVRCLYPIIEHIHLYNREGDIEYMICFKRAHVGLPVPSDGCMPVLYRTHSSQPFTPQRSHLHRSGC